MAGIPNRSENHFRVGDYFELPSSSGCESGHVRWLGRLPELGDELFAGVEFEKRIGSGCGEFFGHRLFRARQDHAALIPAMELVSPRVEGVMQSRMDSLPSLDLKSLRISPASTTCAAVPAIGSGSCTLPATSSTIRMTAHGKWISNESLSLNEMFIGTRRSPAGSGPCYLFRDQPLRGGFPSSICFEVVDLTTPSGGIICFGVTSAHVGEDTIESLPITPLVLTFDSNGKDKWLTSSIYVRKGEKVRLLRDEVAVSVLRQDKFTEHSLAFELDRNAAVYPFFCFTGTVTSIKLLNQDMEPMPKWRPAPKPRQSLRTRKLEVVPAPMAEGFECCICMDKVRAFMCSPCNHVQYCEECKVQAEKHGVKNCPRCRVRVDKYVRVYL